MKKQITKISMLITALFSTIQGFSQLKENFEARSEASGRILPYLTNQCWTFQDMTINRAGVTPISGDSSIVTGQLSNATGASGFTTPYLWIQPGKVLSFNYKTNTSFSGGCRRWFKVVLIDERTNETRIDSFNLSSNPNAVFTYSKTFDINGAYRVYVNFQGTGCATRVAVDNIAYDGTVLGCDPTPPCATVPPGVSDVSRCGTGFVNLIASGANFGDYRWYDANNNLIPNAVGANYLTPQLSQTTQYYVSIQRRGECESVKVPVQAIVVPQPASPTTTGGSICGPGSVALNAAGGTNGNYRWFTSLSGNTQIAGEVNSLYNTPVIPATTTYYVAIVNGTCSSWRRAVVATISQQFTASYTRTGNRYAATPTGGSYKWMSNGVQIPGVGSNWSTITTTLPNVSVEVTKNGCSDVFPDANGRFAVADNGMENDLTLYPNPNQGQFRIEGLLLGEGAAKVTVLDLTGRIVLTQPVSLNEGLFNESFDLSRVGRGIYQLVVEQDSYKKVLKVQVL